MVNKEFIKKWVAALRSGNYKQGQRYLRDDSNNFCCLGVACDLINSQEWYKEKYYRAYSYKGFQSILITDIEMYIGLYNQKDLMEMNDSGKTFNEIADYIEEKYLNGIC